MLFVALIALVAIHLTSSCSLCLATTSSAKLVFASAAGSLLNKPPVRPLPWSGNDAFLKLASFLLQTRSSGLKAEKSFELEAPAESQVAVVVATCKAAAAAAAAATLKQPNLRLVFLLHEN